MPDTVERIARLEREIEALKGTSTQAKPSSASPLPRFDPSAQLTMPPNVMKAMINAFDAQAVANDHIGRPTSLPTVASKSPNKATPNWVDERPLPKFGGENFGTVKERLK